MIGHVYWGPKFLSANLNGLNPEDILNVVNGLRFWCKKLVKRSNTSVAICGGFVVWQLQA